MKLNNRGNLSLIGLLVTVVILGVVLYFYFGGSGGGQVSTVKSDSKMLDKSSKKKTVFGKAIDTSKGVDCEQRLRQIRAAIETYKVSSERGAPPPTLKDAGLSVMPDYFDCPVSKQAYIYDPATGTIRCPYPSHSKF